MPKNFLQPNAGFSLIELMVVVAIAAVLASIAAPSFTSIIESQRIKAASNDLYGSLTRARSEAIKINADVKLSPKTGGWNKGWQVAPVSDSTKIIEEHSELTNITIEDHNDVIFQGSGRTKDSSDTAPFKLIGNSSANRCVYIALSGRPAVKSC